MQKEFSYILTVDDIKQDELTYKIDANKEQLSILKDILKVESVNKFTSNIHLKFSKKQNILEIWGNIEANLNLVSVISLDIFTKDYTSEFNLIYDTKASYKDIKEFDDNLDSQIPDIIIDGKIDLVDISIEQLALLLEDNPRKEGERFTPIIEDSSEIKPNNPFSILSKLKK